GKEIKRVIRGGTFGVGSEHTRCARRVGFYPGRQNYSIGFRLIKSLSQ
ncbi:MAG: hypothetical protein GY795_36835, partial [Desulfobacterales bacterium]|nr:hypothetical protein [Desulfobacterales bacterium]MCP4351064.1 hypothetical protein [Desulfobacterales bacterium]